VPRPGDPLFDNVAAKVSIDQTPNSSFDGSHKTGIANGILPRKLGECPVLKIRTISL
jgi:hypothetical protein